MAIPTWWIVVPMKDTRLAKTRLGGASAGRRQLAIAMARDTLCAVVNTESVEGVLVLCGREEDVEPFSLPGITVEVAPGLNLNQAIRAGRDRIRGERPDANVAAMPGDLPYLHSSELDAALRSAAQLPASVVGDRAGTGTTLLTARAGVELSPAYGRGSLAAHRSSGATELSVPGWSGLRRDVDVLADLAATGSLGAQTKALLAKRPRIP